MKKFLVLFSLVFMVLLVGCEKNGKQVNHEIETMAAQSVSSVLVMDSYEEALRLNSNEQQAAISALEKAQVMLGNKLEIKKEKSDKNDYSSMYQIIYNDSVFKMYVTDTKEKVESEIDEEEVTTKLFGVIAHEGNEYQLEVTKSIEKELGESEEETEVKVIFSQGNYVQVSQEIEEETFEKEETFAYKVVKDGRKVEDFEVTREVEGNREKIQVEVMDQEYEFKEYTVGTDTFIEVKVEDGIRFTLKVVQMEVDGQIVTEYEVQ